jgi:predicted peptidase
MKETLHKRNNQKSIDIDYLLYKPNSYEQNPQNSCPLIVFLHGGSIEENEFETLKEKGINQYITDGNELESLVVSPLHYDPDKFWSE